MNYQSATDQEIWQYCRQDDLRAYKELFRRFAPKLYKQAAGYLKDSMVAEELVMDLLLNIWLKRHEQIMQGDVASYLFRSTRNQVLKHLRKNIPATIGFDSLPEDLVSDQQQADHKLVAADNLRLYENSLLQLSPQRRKVFRLSREENLSYAEIAAEMNLSVNTVENYMVAALKTLRSSGRGEIISSFYIILCSMTN
jgi:RNA polymerase sigma-70 factor (family 1)